MVVGPCIYEFNWKREDYDKLAAGTVAGHIVECGAQCSGGNHTRWWEVEDFTDIGYPIVSINPGGLLLINKNDIPDALNNFSINITNERRVDYSDETWDQLYELSLETFVEESEEKKLSGAGAGLTDND